MSMEKRLLVLENRLRQTEEALVTERRASRRTAEVAQQVVRTCSAGVDVEGIGRLEMCQRHRDAPMHDLSHRARVQECASQQGRASGLSPT